ncbi:leucine-rich repeat extensin-like protein 5 [Chanos chanos]|uniref:Leucine-rich repeat extensin-like protein 5 n=1 Tax=Chanos chanos TaxID=29144 RepID=A0A6J2WTU9_CHACN|nr:leucine-rich repeat extensin-like protein 5 [Chanos chanos]XP_030647688.1 leucine-rich repeat extensin-like protein 5 [Chanos chanos]
MRTLMLLLGTVCVCLAAPVEEQHPRKARSASEEDLQLLLTQMKETLANVNNRLIPQPPHPQRTTTRQVDAQPTAVRIPTANFNPASAGSVPMLNLYISPQPPAGVSQSAMPQKTNPEFVLATPVALTVPSYPSAVVPQGTRYAILSPQQSIPIPVAPFPDAAAISPQTVPVPVQYLPPQSPALLNPSFPNPGFPYGNPFLPPPGSQVNPYSPYDPPTIGITPPIIFRERQPVIQARV